MQKKLVLFFILMLIVLPVAIAGGLKLSGYAPSFTGDLEFAFSRLDYYSLGKHAWINGPTKTATFSPRYVKEEWGISVYTPEVSLRLSGGSVNLIRHDVLEFGNESYVVALYNVTYYVSIKAYAARSSAQAQEITQGVARIVLRFHVHARGNLTIANVQRGIVRRNVYIPGTNRLHDELFESMYQDQSGFAAASSYTYLTLYVDSEKVSPPEEMSLERVFAVYRDIIAEDEVALAPYHAHSALGFDTCHDTAAGHTEIIMPVTVWVYAYKYTPRGEPSPEPPGIGITQLDADVGDIFKQVGFIITGIIAILVLVIILRFGRGWGRAIKGLARAKRRRRK